MFPAAHSKFANSVCTGLIFALALLTQVAAAQDGERAALSRDTLEYYLVQAFQAADAVQRMPLNHIGIEAQAAGDGFLVTAALEGYPAHQAGIERGDRILRIDGEPFHPVHSFNAGDSASEAYAPALATRRIEFERMGSALAADITPVFENLYDSYRSATLNSVQRFSLGNKTIGYLRLWGLTRNTADLFTLELLMHEFAGSDGLIVDLRNAYGYLSSVHLDLFTRASRGYFETSGDSSPHTEIAEKFPISTARPFTKPIVVLINSGTRAGAELLAFELSKMSRITTLGENSLGRIGTYSAGIDGLNYIPADNALIDDSRFESTGVTPKQSIPFPFDQGGGNDPQFQASVDILLGII